MHDILLLKMLLKILDKGTTEICSAAPEMARSIQVFINNSIFGASTFLIPAMYE
jgi:hypothetical protein